MTVIYNPNTGIIAKIIFKIETKKKIRSFESNNSCSSVSFVSTPFLLVRIALSDWSSLITPWMNHRNISVPTREMNATEKGGQYWRDTLQFFGVRVMSVGWTILHGTSTDWNLDRLACGELRSWAPERLKMFQTGVQSQEGSLTERVTEDVDWA